MFNHKNLNEIKAKTEERLFSFFHVLLQNLKINKNIALSLIIGNLIFDISYMFDEKWEFFLTSGKFSTMIFRFFLYLRPVYFMQLLQFENITEYVIFAINILTLIVLIFLVIVIYFGLKEMQTTSKATHIINGITIVFKFIFFKPLLEIYLFPFMIFKK